jgi:hypothetical protein
VDWIAKEISAVYEVDVNVVSVKPFHWPRVNHAKPKAAILKTPGSAGEIGAVHVKRVAAAKAGAKSVVRNSFMAARRLLLSVLLLRRSSLLLCALLLLRRFGLLLCTLLLLRRLGGLLLCML